MLEAVNSTLQTAQMVRGTAEQASVTDSYAANPERVQRAAPQAPYVSPYIYMNTTYNKAILQIRDSDTGDVVNEYPNETRLQLQARQEAARAAAAQTQETAAQTASSSSSSASRATGGDGGAASSAESVSSAPVQAPTAPAPQVTPSAQISARQIAAFETASASAAPAQGSIEILA